MKQITTKTNQKKWSVHLKQALILILTFFSMQAVSQNKCNATFKSFSNNGYVFHFYPSSDSILYNYAWDFGDGLKSTLKTPAHFFKTSGTHTICLRISSQIDPLCFDTFCDTINAAELCGASFEAYRDSKNPRFVHITNSSVGKNLRYFWNFGDGKTSTEANPKLHTYDNADNQLIKLTITDTINPCSDSIQRLVPSLCSAEFGFSFKTYDHASFKPIKDSIIFDYAWSFGDGTTSTDAKPEHLYAKEGSYIVCLSISDKNKFCWADHCDTIDVKTTGIKKNKLEKAFLQNYPNPIKDHTTIDYTLGVNSAIELSVYDLLGNCVDVIEQSSKVAGNYTKEWDPSKLADGIYLLQLITKDQLITKKIILQK